MPDRTDGGSRKKITVPPQTPPADATSAASRLALIHHRRTAPTECALAPLYAK
jgi:hypothetical protein